MSYSQAKINAIRLVGGLPALDFLNTCDGRRPGTSLRAVVDKLSSLQDIVHWYAHAGLITPQEHQRFIGLTDESTWHHLDAFQQLIDFREALYRLLLPVALGRRIDDEALAALNRELVRTGPERVLVATPGGVIWLWCTCDSLDAMTASLIGRVAVQAAALLTGPDVARLKACGTPDCDWLFVDISKNGRRRWCQMNVCGSREKARRVAHSADSSTGGRDAASA
ncbi:CGNR zinc finger domain-containing protein [Pseudomonas huanghezhanensis]|uniref:CGNR zinc finger domain-containing protein n=1 Tax=Pseudomonas huanghezhanensis TaxID=3002903 RepID=UPI002286B444|nr:ABATE domain-containing protein [Pseudomonas sp. BSw22131]